LYKKNNKNAVILIEPLFSPKFSSLKTSGDGVGETMTRSTPL